MKLKEIKASSINCLFVGVIFISGYGCMDNKDQKILNSHPTKISNTFPDYYSKLFREEIRNKLKLTWTYEHIGQDTVCDFLFDEQYYISLYTLSRSYSSSLQNLLKENAGESAKEISTPFFNNAAGPILIYNRISTTSDDNPSDIFISYSGKGFSTIKKNDSIADYYYQCKSISIRYKVKDRQEIFAKTRDDISEYKPVEIIFLRKEGRLFLIFITSKKDAGVIPDDLKNILFKDSALHNRLKKAILLPSRVSRRGPCARC